MKSAFAPGLALVMLGLSACSGAGVEFDEEFAETMELGQHEAALQNDGSGPVEEDKCTTQMQDCYLDCSVTRYPESNDSPNNFNELMREGCLDSCDAANRVCRSLGMTRGGGGRFDIAVDRVLSVDPRPAGTRTSAAGASKATTLAR